MRSKLFLYWNAYRLWIILGALLLVGISIYLASRGDGNGLEVRKVEPTSFERRVTIAGKVVPAREVDLGFEVSGKVSAVYAEVGDQVATGEVLVRLESGTYFSDLEKAEAEVALRLAGSDNESVNLESIEKEQETLVRNAYRNLLSEGLVAVPHSDTYDIEAPLISGSYESDNEGEYKIRIIPKSAGSDRYELLTFELERTRVEILENEPTPLGSKGLFVTFPDDISDYADTMWYIAIPNTKSSVYAQNKNAYEEALRRKETEITSAENKVRQADSGASISEIEVRQGRAEVAKILSEIAKRTIKAPFAGVVTRQEAKVGSIVGANTVISSLVTNNSFQIETFVPEINISEVKVGNTAEVTLDAYQPAQIDDEDIIFLAKVVHIDPAETVRDGVSTYKVTFEFVENDTRLKSGMTANVIITTEERENALLVPQSALIRRDGFTYVIVRVKGEYIEKQITTGAIASTGDIEVVSGLRAGEELVLEPTKVK